MATGDVRTWVLCLLVLVVHQGPTGIRARVLDTVIDSTSEPDTHENDVEGQLNKYKTVDMKLPQSEASDDEIELQQLGINGKQPVMNNLQTDEGESDKINIDEQPFQQDETDSQQQSDTFTPEIIDFIRNLVTKVEFLAQKNYNYGPNVPIGDRYERPRVQKPQQQPEPQQQLPPAAATPDLERESRDNKDAGHDSLLDKEDRIMIGDRQMVIDKRGRLIYKEEDELLDKVPVKNHIQAKDAKGRTVPLGKDAKGTVKARAQSIAGS